MQNYQPLPSYSLADLFRDINNGVTDIFTFDGSQFNAKRINFKWVVTDLQTGHTAQANFYVGSMTDLQGLASCLQSYKKNLVFDKDGNIKYC
jgi:hypothetical protein